MPKKNVFENIPNIINEPNLFQIQLIPIFLIDYIWVIFIYASAAFWLGVLIDGHLLPKFDISIVENRPIPILYTQVILQIALQGFLAIFIIYLLQKIPSPVQFFYSTYSIHSPEALLIRNPAIFSIILFNLSKSLQGRLTILINYFNKNSAIVSAAMNQFTIQNAKQNENNKLINI
jgi:hypothetical protein